MASRSSFHYQWRMPLGVTGLIVAAWLVWPSAPDAPAPAADRSSPQAAAQAKYTPAPASAPASTPANTMVTEQAPERPSVNAAQQLVVNQGLLNIFNFYLLGGFDGNRLQHAAQLRAFLNANLPAPAQEEAKQLVNHYLAYMDQHDGLLARQGLALPASGEAVPTDFIERVATWIGQRARLRQTELGMATAQAWFGDEENRARQIIADLRQKYEAAASAASDADPAMARDARVHGAALANRLAQDTEDFARQATQSFAGTEQREQQFKQHFLQYQRALDQLGPLEQLDPLVRNARLDELRPRFMLTEFERERARQMGK